jgi:uncharacterized membrane protein YfcA
VALIWGALTHLPTRFIPVTIGTYVLRNLWLLRFSSFIQKYENFYLAGAVQTGLGLIVGATSPLTSSLLMKTLNDKDGIVATNALFTSFSHRAKLGVFTAVGFQFREYWPVVLTMSCGAIIGSYLGTLIRKRISCEKFLILLKIALTLLALRMIVYAAL